MASPRASRWLKDAGREEAVRPPAVLVLYDSFARLATAPTQVMEVNLALLDALNIRIGTRAPRLFIQAPSRGFPANTRTAHTHARSPSISSEL